jgi:hypothetical protein
MFKVLNCGEREIKLRYTAGTLFSIAASALEVVGQERLDLIKYKPIRRQVPVEVVLRFIDTELDILLWLFGKGLDWKESGAKPEEANDLFDAYMDVPEDALDTGERFESFKLAVCEAIAAARGINLKKMMEKQKADQEKAKSEIEASLASNLTKRLKEVEAERDNLQAQLAETQQKLAEALRSNLKKNTGRGSTGLASES